MFYLFFFVWKTPLAFLEEIQHKNLGFGLLDGRSKLRIKREREREKQHAHTQTRTQTNETNNSTYTKGKKKKLDAPVQRDVTTPRRVPNGD